MTTDELPYTVGPGDFTDQEHTLLEVWCQMREPAPGSYTLGSKSKHPLQIVIANDGHITKVAA